MSKDDLQLLKGTLDVMVLRALREGPRHGYAVAEWIRAMTEDTLHVDDGALYTSLHRLEKRGLVEAEWGLSENNRKAKYYQLSPRGRARLEEQTKEWARYASAVSRVLGVRQEGAPS
jgi:transcriptional regulator